MVFKFLPYINTTFPTYLNLMETRNYVQHNEPEHTEVIIRTTYHQGFWVELHI